MTIRGFGRGRGRKKDPDLPNTLFANINPPALTQSELSSNLQQINNIQSNYSSPAHLKPSHTTSPYTSPNARANNGVHSSRDAFADAPSEDTSSSHYQSNCTEVIRVDENKIGRIIGSRGATINQIQDESGARVDIAKDSDGYEKEVTLSGPADAVAKARDMINDIISDNHSNNRQSTPRAPSNPSENTEVFRVAENSVGRIIGKSGCTINQIRDETGVNIDISRDSVGYDKEVTLSGTPSGIAKAKDMISDLVAIIGNDEPVIKKGVIDYDAPIDWGQIAANEVKYRHERWGVLPPVEKEFYFEDPEVSRFSDRDVERIRAENMAIEVSHYIRDEDKDKPEVYVPIPKPILTFEHAFKNYPDILAEIFKQGFKEPSPIQKQMWPVLLAGHDCIGVAQTGTGKTLAFLLPAFIHIEAQATPRSKRVGPTVFCLAPTRELALQIKWEVTACFYF